MIIEQYQQLLELLKNEDFSNAIHFSDYNECSSKHNRASRPHIIVNDLWFPASDSESFDLAQIWEITDMWNKYQYVGLAAWVGVKRCMEPGSSWYDDPRDTGDDYVEAWYYTFNNNYAREVPAISDVEFARSISIDEIMQNNIYFNWRASIGYGQLSTYNDTDGKIWLNTEMLSKETARMILYKFVDKLLDEGTEE